MCVNSISEKDFGYSIFCLIFYAVTAFGRAVCLHVILNLQSHDIHLLNKIVFLILYNFWCTSFSTNPQMHHKTKELQEYNSKFFHWQVNSIKIIILFLKNAVFHVLFLVQEQ